MKLRAVTELLLEAAVMDAPGTLVEVAVVPEVNVTAPELTNENDEAAPLVTLDATAAKLTSPDRAMMGTKSR